MGGRCRELKKNLSACRLINPLPAAAFLRKEKESISKRWPLLSNEHWEKPISLSPSGKLQCCLPKRIETLSEPRRWVSSLLMAVKLETDRLIWSPERGRAAWPCR